MPMATRDVVERFPEHLLTIKRLVVKNESFRAMCEDYAAGVEALRRWNGSRDPKREARIAELRASLAEIEDEIQTALEQEAHRSG